MNNNLKDRVIYAGAAKASGTGTRGCAGGGPDMNDKKYVRACSITRALDVIGDHAALLILECAFLGVRKFDAFQRRTGLLRPLLSNRLKQLVESGLLTKVAYCERPLRYEYRLTEKGRGLYPAALMMVRWERRWAPLPRRTELRLVHALCGCEADPVPVCTACGGEIDAREVEWREGPGVGLVLPHYDRRRRQTRMPEGDAALLLDTVLRVVGDRWSSLILRSGFMGLTRYDEIREETQIATNILADRLRWLCAHGFLVKRTYQESPSRHEYRLTEKARDLYPVLTMLLQWGDRWYASPEGPPILLTHRRCGAPLEPAVVCSVCKEPLHIDQVRFEMLNEAGSLPGMAQAAAF